MQAARGILPDRSSTVRRK